MSHQPNNLASKVTFMESFFISGIVACISKTVSAPLERVKLLMQNQDELLRNKVISEKYKGLGDCIMRTYHNEGVLPFWRGNWANCIRYFPTQALTFSFKGKINNFKSLKVLKEDSTSKKLFKNMMSGGLAGSASLLFVYTLDYARTRLGNDAVDSKTGKRKYNGLLDVYKQTYKSDGIPGLYRGFVVSCFGIFVYRGFYFGLYDTAKPIMMGTDNSFWKSFLIGYVVTITAEMLAYPNDTVRRRMMMTSGEQVKYKGGIDCFLQIVQKEGFSSLMKGSIANILRGVSAAGVLAGYDKVIEWYLTLVGRVEKKK
jgi:solute carrier family 25 (adenine nucleotide translocator) protein 4/5/6/31